MQIAHFFKFGKNNLKVLTCDPGVETVVWSAVQQEQAGTKKRDKGEKIE